MKLETVWIQNLVYFVEGKLPANEEWKAIFIKNLKLMDGMTQTNSNMLRLYADSYKSMSRMGDGMVSASDVAYDIKNNMVPQLVPEMGSET